jgi:uncharacterized protein
VIAYFDTSAIVLLVVDEPGTELAGRMWDGADRLVSSRLARVEAGAALAQAARVGRLTSRQLLAAKRELDGLLDQLDLVYIDDELVRSAAELAEAHALCAYDAVHLAAAARLAADDVVVVAGDRALLAGARTMGLAVATVA